MFYFVKPAGGCGRCQILSRHQSLGRYQSQDWHLSLDWHLSPVLPKFPRLLLGGLLLCLLSSSALAADASDYPTLESVLQQIITSVQSLNQTIQEFSRNLLTILVLISMVFYGISLLFKTATNLVLINAYFVRLILVFGCFNYLILNGHQIARDIINSFIMLPTMTTGTFTVAFTNSLNSFFQLVEQLSSLFINHQSTIFVVGLCIMFIILSLFLINFALTYLSAFFVSCMGILTLAFGMFSSTKFMAVNYLKLVLGYGLKMLTLSIIFVIGQDIFTSIFSIMQLQVVGGQVLTVQDMGLSIFIMYFIYAVSLRVPKIVMGFVSK